MCRAGKDKTRRYCPATTDKERIAERKARRSLAYMVGAAQKKLAAAEAEIAEHPEYDDKKKAEVIDNAGFKATDLLYQRHLDYVHGVITKLRKTGKETHLLHTSKTTEGGETVWDEDRAVIHREIIMEQLKAWENVPCDGEAIFSGGLGGAGKGTVLKNPMLNIDQKNYATLNPDDIKEVLADKGLIPKVDGLTPMEASPLVHEEAAYITDQLAKIVTSRKMNVIHDLTMANYDSVKRKTENLRAMGYTKIEAVFVDISIDTSSERADARHLRGHNRWLTGKGQGGRVVPHGISAKQVPEDDAYRSLNAENFLQLKADGYFDSTVAYDNNVKGRPPIKLDTLKTSELDKKAAA